MAEAATEAAMTVKPSSTNGEVKPSVVTKSIVDMDDSELDSSGLPVETIKEIRRKRTENANLRAKLQVTEMELSKIKAAQDEAAKKAAEEQGEFKKLYEKTKEEVAATRTKFTQRIARAELRSAAVGAGIIDPKDIDLVPLDGIEVTDDGAVAGIEAAVAKFKMERPHWFKADAPAKPAVTATGASTGTPAPSKEPPVSDVRKLSKEDYEARKREELEKIRRIGRTR